MCIGHIASNVINLCNTKFPTCSIYSLPLWGASSSEYFAEQISQYETVVTIEDHILEGGFGSYTLETVAKYKLKTRVIPIALQREIVGKVAKEETLLKPIIEDLNSCLEAITCDT